MGSKRKTGVGEVDMAGLDRQVGFLLRLAQVAVFNDLIGSLKPLGLRPSDYSALLVIAANPGLKQQLVGDALGIQRTNLVGLLDDLVQRGLVTRSVVPGDRRSWALALTDGGQAMLAEARKAHAGHEAKLQSLLGDKVDQATLRDVLKLISSL